MKIPSYQSHDLKLYDYSSLWQHFMIGNLKHLMSRLPSCLESWKKRSTWINLKVLWLRARSLRSVTYEKPFMAWSKLHFNGTSSSTRVSWRWVSPIHFQTQELKQPISSIHLKVSPRLLTRVEGKRGEENRWVQESYSKSYWGNSKRTWLKFSGGDFGLYILLIMFVHDCMGSTDTVCIRQTLSPGLWMQRLSRQCIEWKHRHVWCVRHQKRREEKKA